MIDFVFACLTPHQLCIFISILLIKTLYYPAGKYMHYKWYSKLRLIICNLKLKLFIE